MKDENNNIQDQNNLIEEKNSIMEVKSDIMKNHNLVEEHIEEINEDVTEKIKGRKIMKWSIISICSLLFIYLGISTYFMNRFYFGTEINAISVAGKTVEEVNAKISADIEKYVLVLDQRGGKKEELSAADIGLKFNSHNSVQEFKDSQNSFQWIYGLFNRSQAELTNMVSYDEELLKQSLNKLSCFNSNNITEPKNATIKYEEKGYEIVKEVEGNKVNKDILYNGIVAAILKEEKVVNFETINCYEKPQYTATSSEILEAKDLLNKYVALTITYTFDQGKEVLDGSTIKKWIEIDDKFQITFNEEKVREYVNNLASNYDTLGKPREFKTSSGSTVKLSSGYYGTQINRAKEVQDLIRVIKEGESTTKKPLYAQNTMDEGIGNTYVEIDLTRQHIWFYKNGSLITQGNIVSGNMDGAHNTPPGIFRLTYKQKNAILRGPGYAAPVSFWMPFNGDIGIHDATWRSAFGGNIYKTDGSHGCINAPYNVAQEIFNNIEAGMFVICYY